MKNSWCIVLILIALTGCRDSRPEGTEEREALRAAGMSPSGDAPANGFREGKGVYICDETRKSIQLQLTEVIEDEKNPGIVLVPASSILDSPQGALAYVANQDYFIKTSVKAKRLPGGMVEIAEGLLAGDSVVVHPMAVRMIELNVTRAGAACCAVELETGRQ